MSSADEGSVPPSKKRKFQRACDYCRRKKIRCDGPQLPNNRCSRCTARQMECTYKETLHKGSYPSSYVENLESRLDRMEKLVNKLCPDAELSRELENPNSDKETPAYTPSVEHSRPGTSRPEAANPVSPAALARTPHTPTGSDDYEASDNDTEENRSLMDGMRKLSVNPYRYHGKSSGLVFIRTAVDLKNQCAPDPAVGTERTHRRHPWMRHTTHDELPIFGNFPPGDLLDSLVNLYFRNVNDVFPLLHEPTFKASIKSGMHLRQGGFGATVLLVCAIASRYTHDPRVLLDGCDELQSAGWKWYQEVESVHKLSLAPAQLYDLQIYVLMVEFLQGTSSPQATWTLIGHGIRRAVDVGAHRRTMYSRTPTIEEELWRRAFWMLVVLDWTAGHSLGRPASIHDEDIDLALPTEADDEYWPTSGADYPVIQPPGKPSKVSFFVYFIRLSQVLAFASRTIYSINKSKAQLGHGDSQWEQRIVAELDSALNKWTDSLPSHLRWNPDQPSNLWLTQAGTLTSHYYQFQVAVHRPFMSTSRRESPLSFPCVIICTNAARTTIQVLEHLCKRTGSPYQKNMGALFMSGIVLMMNIWGQRRSGLPVRSDRDMAYVRKCIPMLQILKNVMHASESLWEILNELVVAANTPPPPSSTDLASSSTTALRTIETSEALSGPSFASITFAQPAIQAPQGNQGAAQGHDSKYRPPHPTEVVREHPLPRSSVPPKGKVIQQRSPPEAVMSAFAPSHVAVPADPQTKATVQPAGMQDESGVWQSNEFDLAGSAMFGLEPLGYSEAVSLLPSVNNPAATGYPAACFSDAGMSVSQGEGEGGVPDFAFIDDTLSMWSTAPASFGWDDWDAYLTNSNASDRTNGGI